MDPLDIMLHMEDAKPYFQAIFSADSHMVTGYQVLGYMETDEGMERLADFFLDTSVPEEFKIDMDRHLHKAAIETFICTDMSATLHLIVHEDYLLKPGENDFIQEIVAYEELGLDLKKLVVEIVEQDDVEDISSLANSLKYLKTFGVKIAINDVLKITNNLDRISLLEPDIIKINVTPLQNQSYLENYQNIIYSMSLLARKVGAELMFDGINSNYQFHYAWRKNGRYYQGDFFSPPEAHFVDPDIWKDRFRHDISQFIAIERSNILATYQLTSNLNERFHQLMSTLKKIKQLDDKIEALANELQDISFRLYVTDGEGFQRTANIELSEGSLRIDEEARGKNWSWRPYFIENVIQMNEAKKGILSDVYSDIETGEIIRTFSYPMEDNLFLFMDISQMYLDEHPFLLW
ncbi:EAL-associated domain-containing protein [Gracilibacillus marinus]|uniref:EAL-associated domain-containing protein n=1 Tax=Gracilibacillus marinus TaxID=630535 RepID=A0ABV8VW04_9BACI